VVVAHKLIDDWLTDYTAFDGTDIITSELETGELSIIHNGGNNYTVDIDLEMTDGTTFIGSYTGDFKLHLIISKSTNKTLLLFKVSYKRP
jgi:hypothetical protein